MLVPVSNGELMDKYSILLIKKEFINDLTKTNYVNQEITYLLEYVNKIKTTYNIDEVFNKLIEVNKKLWVIEDELRVKEKKQEFDKEFIELARSVYFTNDERAFLKKQINEDTDSNIFEVKSYEKYN
tara:strand:+ start:7446 stop:7826 length:381 start_codon:yes stop_codon:yes gene_type:complete